MREPIWLELQAILILHRESLEEHGGLDGIRDEGLLESAFSNRPWRGPGISSTTNE